MRILLDTNLLIGREDLSYTDPRLAALLQRLTGNQVILVLHPVSLSEVDRDTNEQRRMVVRSKLRTYPLLEDPPSVSSEITDVLGQPRNRHDAGDFSLLAAVKQNAVNFLVTEDRDLVRRAYRIGLRDRVLDVASACEFFEELFGRKRPAVPTYVREVAVHSLNLSDPFFDSFKSEYSEFPGWFQKISAQGRMSWAIWLPGKELGALLIYKEEEEAIEQLLPRVRRLKICSLKVARSLAGYRVGELLLSIALSYCSRNGIAETYVTVFPKYGELVDLLTEFGFKDAGESKRGERVMLKHLRPPVDAPPLPPLEHLYRFFPDFLDGPGVRKFLVPVRPAYHKLLFPDLGKPGHQTTLYGIFGGAHAAGNAIRKAYICGRANAKLRVGDILLFYRSTDWRTPTHRGIVERSAVCSTVDDVLDLVGNRTVLPLTALGEMTRSRAFAILFWNLGPLNTAHEKNRLEKLRIAWPQTITEVTDEDYHRICS